MSLENAPTGVVRSLAGNRDLRLLLTAGFVSQTGDWILGTGLAFEVYALTGSTVASAAVLLAGQIPQVVLGPVAGIAADRWDRRRLMVVADLVLAAVLLPLLAVHDGQQVWIADAVVAASACVSPFFAAAEATVLPALVDEQRLVSANALNAQAQNVARLVGAALGGVAVAAGGLTLIALADAGTFVLAAGLLALLPRRDRPTGRTRRPSLLHDLLEGLAAARGSRAMRVVVLFFVLTGFGEAAMGSLFAPFVHDVLGASAAAYGAVLAAQAVGGIAGAALLTAFGHRCSARALFGWGAVLFGAIDTALFLYPLLTRQVWPALVLIGVVGLPGAAVFAGVLTVFQTSTDDASRGRVFGTLTALQSAAVLVGTLVVGGAAEAVGIVPVIVVQGAVYLLIGAIALAALRGEPAEAVPSSALADDDPAALLDNPAVRMRIPSMPLASNVRIRSVTDPLALRALAHPIRQDLYELVAREGSLTAADAARQLDISHALASHHLRQLAKYGFIEPAETSGNRARPWRVVSTSLEVRPSEPEGHEARDALDRYESERAAQQLADWQQRRADEDPAWTEPAGVRSGLLYLNPEELRALVEGWNALVRPLADRRPIGHAAERPADAEPVSVTLVAVPLRRTESGG